MVPTGIFIDSQKAELQDISRCIELVREKIAKADSQAEVDWYKEQVRVLEQDLQRVGGQLTRLEQANSANREALKLGIAHALDQIGENAEGILGKLIAVEDGSLVRA